ncbi:MAG: RelA/SpoT family protein [Prevotella sp.]|nr:RelA/SpoT family protein [Prevotella sp.]
MRILNCSATESQDIQTLLNRLECSSTILWNKQDVELLQKYFTQSIPVSDNLKDRPGLNIMSSTLQTAVIAAEEIGLKRDGVIATLLYPTIGSDTSMADIERDFGTDVERIISGLTQIRELYKKNPVIESENFRNLLLLFAKDMRVILIMIADRLNLMRNIHKVDNEEARQKIADETSYLYAPLAHKLGLYQLKSELEDLSLKYLERDAYYHIKEKLNATKRSRDAYIQEFILPVEEKLQAAGLKFHIKGRTKSIHSIWQKMKKQKCEFEGIYDLFAIRIIIDAEPEKEKMQCWQAYSVVTDMYQPNPKRLRDWLSVPKSNGYESLHITVLGPKQKWVEVQIRTERMDEIAEKGLAAHWRYKGVTEERGLDEWLSSIRSALEAGDDLQVMDHFKLDLAEEEVYVFTPKGEILKFPAGATILDFAYRIHSKVGNACVGGKINNHIVPVREVLHSGDQVEIVTSPHQKPKLDWLNIVKTSRSKAKIRLALKETQMKTGAYAKEILERKFKNRKLEPSESAISQVINRMGFKETSEFYKQIIESKLDVNDVIEQYLLLKKEEQEVAANKSILQRSAEDFVLETQKTSAVKNAEDVLVIDENVKGIDYVMAKCCQPVYGDPVFGFVTIKGSIKIHRNDCPNATELHKRFGYRIVKAQWSGKGSSLYTITLRIIGTDNIGVVNNITSIISKEENILIRSLSIDSDDGLFRGNLKLQIDDNNRLQTIMKKIKDVKGVKIVERI